MNYYQDETDDVGDNASDGQSFKFKTKIVGNTPELLQSENPGDANQPAQKSTPTSNVEVTAPLKYLGNFWRFLYLTLINREVALDLSQAKNIVLIEHHNNVTGVNFRISSTKLYVPVVTLSISNNIKLLENIKQGFKRTISWNEDLKKQYNQTTLIQIISLT